MKIAKHGQTEVAIDASKRVHHRLGIARIERGDGLVGQNDLRLLHEGARDGDALLLSAGKRLGPFGRKTCHVELLQGRQRDGLIFGRPHIELGAPGLDVPEASHEDVGQYVQAPDEIELLEDHGAARAPGLESRSPEARDVLALPQDATAGRLAQSVNSPQQRRFAGARAADHAEKAALGNLEIDIGDRSLVAKALAQALNLQHRRPRLVNPVTPAPARASG